MKPIVIGLAIWIAVAAAPSQAQGPRAGETSEGGPHGEQPAARAPNGTTPDDPQGIAEDLRLQGRCDQAVPILRRISDQAGYEVAQYDLGLCLLDLAQAEHDTERTAAFRDEDAKWVLRAANAGFARAQEKAAFVCLEGMGVAADPVEAAKWALLYRSNGQRLAISLPDLGPELTFRLHAAITDNQRAHAKTRADSWLRTMQGAEVGK